jgi:hypothetical protein
MASAGWESWVDDRGVAAKAARTLDLIRLTLKVSLIRSSASSFGW